jgi:S-adenosylmethionine hydrolase
MITLSSDFGSPYPGAMKGVLLGRTDAQLVDVSHDLPRGDVRAGAFWLREVLPWFPPAVHLAVVDPGVGTDRRAIAVRAGDHALVGPDNGLLMPVARALANGGFVTYQITVEDPPSSTFHGRDVFAPAAGEIHRAGLAAMDDLELLDPGVDPVDLQLPDPTLDADRARGEVLVVDGFGNVVTNLPGELLAGLETVEVNGEPVPVGDTFASVPAGERLATVGSHGNVELDVNDGRGDDVFGLAPGDEVELAWE